MPRPTPTPGAINAPTPTPTGIAPGRSAPPSANGSGDAATPAVAQKGGPQLGIEALSAIAAKLDSAVTALLSAAGPRAPEIKLPMLPPDHQISQLLSAVKQVLPNIDQNGSIARTLTATEQEGVLGFSQGIFKRLYELNLSEPLRLEAFVALLENINVSCPKLGKDIGTWSTYAPTNTETQRRLHRTVLLLLIRSRLLAVNDLDVFLAARADDGRNHIWVEFSLLFIRTAFLERISMPSDFPKLIDLMTRIAEGRSQASPQVLQTYTKPILRMLEETRGLGPSADPQPSASGVQPPAEQRRSPATIQQSSSLSPASLSRMAVASQKVADATAGFTKNDPPNSRQQVTTLLDNWIRVYTEAAGNEKLHAQFLQYLQQVGVGKVEEQTERFLRLSVLVVMEAVSKTVTSGNNGSRTMLNYTVVDVYSKLLVLMFRHLNSGGTAEQAEALRLSMLNKILGVSVRAMMWDAENAKKSGPRAQWDQRPWFRLFLNLLIDINKPDPSLEPIKLGVLSVFGAAFHVAQPLVLPGE
jgi:CCR4-NOT transcription complex subunit 1